MKMRSLLVMVLALAMAPLARGQGVIVVLAGALTSELSRVEPGPPALTKLTDKYYFVFDVNSGAFQRLHLFKVGALKKYSVGDSGTLLGQVLPANADNTKSNYLYYALTDVNLSLGGFTVNTTKGWQEWKGLATAAVGADINLLYPFPASLKLLRRVNRDYHVNVGLPAPLPNDVYFFQESGTLKTVRALSKAANDAGDNLAAAVVRVQAYLVGLGYTP